MQSDQLWSCKATSYGGKATSYGGKGTSYGGQSDQLWWAKRPVMVAKRPVTGGNSGNIIVRARHPHGPAGKHIATRRVLDYCCQQLFAFFKVAFHSFRWYSYIPIGRTLRIFPWEFMYCGLQAPSDTNNKYCGLHAYHGFITGIVGYACRGFIGLVLWIASA